MKKTRKRQSINMLGYEFQTWKVISQSDKKSSGNNTYWLCECQVCGKQKELCGTEIRLGRTGACKHIQKKDIENKEEQRYYHTDISNSNKIKNEIGNIYGKLTVTSFAYIKNSHAYWNCLCKCGKTCVVKGNALRNGDIASCGCLISKKEVEICSILDKLQIKYKQQFKFEDLKDKGHLRFDFALFDQNDNLKGLIEYQGQQHYEEAGFFNHFGLLQEHDKMKREYCLKHNISLLELNKTNFLYDDIKNWWITL